MSKFVKISRKEFEEFLGNNFWWSSCPEELYALDWLGSKDGKIINPAREETWERCYLIKIAGDVWINVFSSVDRKTNESRPVGKDSIKVVPFSNSKLKPIMKRIPTIYRVNNWRYNFIIRINSIIEKLGNKMDCPECGRKLNIKKNNRETNKHFIGCKYSICKFNKNIKV
jgi:hypothetical protein